MARIPTLTLDTMSAEQRRIYEGIMQRRGPVQGPLLAALHRPLLGETWGHFGDAIRAHTSIPKILTAIAILQATRHMNCQYMWATHVPLAEKAGLRADIIESIRLGQTPKNLDADQVKIWHFCTELLEKKALTDATQAAVRDTWGVTGAVDLAAIIGYYTLCAMMIGANDLALPDRPMTMLPPLSD